MGWSWSFGLLCLLSSALRAESIQDYRPSSRNLTSDFQQLQVSSPTSLTPANSERFQVLLVPGFLSDTIRAMRHLPLASQLGLGEYFDDQISVLNEHQIPFEWAAIDSEESSEQNAKIIAQQMEDAERPVLLISHSKGGLDVLAALLAHPELISKVYGWITMNSPFQGTPLADAFNGYGPLRYATAEAMMLLGGSEKTVRELTENSRQTFFLDHRSQIEALLKQIPMISLASWKPNIRGKIDTYLELTRNYILKKGYLNDGAVPYLSCILPGMNYIVLSGLDHSSAVNANRFTKFDRKSALLAMFEMIETLRPQIAAATLEANATNY